MPGKDWQPVGKIEGIFRYPVKSMRGEQVREAPLRWVGFAGDRRYSFARSGNTARFPWLTAKIFAPLLTYTPYFCDVNNPNESAVRVVTPDSLDLSIESPELAEQLSKLYQNEVFLLQIGRGIFDSSPISIITTQTVDFVAEQIGMKSDFRRFRPNLLVKALTNKPFVEDEWVGSSLIIGQQDLDPRKAPRLHLDRPIERCVIVNHDPDSTVSEPQVLKLLGRIHQTNAGVYGTVETLGTVKEGDLIYRSINNY